MDVFYADLDNTLMYSYRHGIGKNKICVETYQGREISFITEKTHSLLLELKKHMLIVPVTTRTVGQYGRVDLKVGPFRYALTCNGGMLLVDGRLDGEWYRQSLRLVQDSRGELEKAAGILQEEPSRILDVRFLEGLFVFTKCRFPKEVLNRLQAALDARLVDIFHNGEKVYAVPKKLNKGTSVQRFREYVNLGQGNGNVRAFAAGDSAFDVPMLSQADIAAAPAGLGICSRPGSYVCHMPGKAVFSEELLEFMLRYV